MDLMVEASPRRIFANAHTYHINSISVNSDHETYLSADDLRINLWHLEITDRSFNIVDIKPANMEELTEVITAAEFHPHQCNVFVHSSSKGTVRLCDTRSSALCDRHSKCKSCGLKTPHSNFCSPNTRPPAELEAVSVTPRPGPAYDPALLVSILVAALLEAIADEKWNVGPASHRATPTRVLRGIPALHPRAPWLGPLRAIRRLSPLC